MAVYNVIGIGEHKKYFDESSYYDVTNYILNHATYFGAANIQSINNAADEMLNVAIVFNKNKGKRVRHSVLSFGAWESVTPEMADEFAQKIILHYADRFQILYAVHTNTDEVHIHFVMNMVSFVDGSRYDGKKADYYAFRKHMQAITHRAVLT